MLTRKMLSAMEIEAEKITQIINGHTETVSALQGEIDEAKAEAAKYKAEAEKLSGVKAELDTLKKQVEADAKERKDKDYDALKKEFDAYKAEQQRISARAAKEAAFTDILKDAGIPEKYYAKIIKYSDVDGIELDDKGKAVKAKDILKSIKDEWSDHIPQTHTQGASTSSPPFNDGGSKMTREQIAAITDTAARQRAMLENHELYGV